MALQHANENLVVVIAGCSGSGKSTIAIIYLNNGDFSCRWIFDPRREYAERFGRRPVTTGAEIRAAIQTGWVIFQPHTLYPDAWSDGPKAPRNFKKALKDFLDMAWMMSENIPGQKIVFVDEIWRCCSPSHLPVSLANIIQDGRKNGVGLLATTQVPHRMNESIIGEATELIALRLEGRNKLKFLEDNADNFPVAELPNLLLIDKVRAHCVAMNMRSRCVRRYELDLQTGKLSRLRGS